LYLPVIIGILAASGKTNYITGPPAATTENYNR